MKGCAWIAIIDVSRPHSRTASISRRDPLLQCGSVHFFDFGTGDRRLAVADAEHLGDGCGGDLVIASDHRHADAATLAFRHRLDRFLAWRVEGPIKPSRTRFFGRSAAVRLPALIPGLSTTRDPDALTLAGEFVGGLHEMVAR